MGVGSVLVVIVALLVAYGFYQRGPQAPQAQGSCTERFKAVEDIYRANYASGLESGSAFAVYHEGALVCDLWGGWADPTTGLPWRQDTMPIVFSVTKSVAAFTMAHLCDKGLCDYNDLVTKYWPEFGQNGKENVTIGMLLSHQAGLAAIDRPVTLEMLAEENAEVSRLLAAQVPNWPPGTALGYHAISFGPYVDQLVRRVDPRHRPLEQVFREDIALPYDIDFYIGAPLAEQWRVARYNVQPLLSAYWDVLFQPLMRTLMYKIVTGDPYIQKVIANTGMPTDESHLNWPHRRAVPQASYNGFGTARALARLFSLVVASQHHNTSATSGGTKGPSGGTKGPSGGTKGPSGGTRGPSGGTKVGGTKGPSGAGAAPLLSQRAVELLHEPLISGKERVFGFSVAMGPGVMIGKTTDEKGNVMIFHPGKGSQIGLGVRDLALSLAYITNFPSALLDTLQDPRVVPLYEAVLAAAKKP